MFAEYLSIVRVLRRPMRQWWLSTGSWWLALFAACHLYGIFYVWQIQQQVVAQIGTLSSELLAFAVLNSLSAVLRSVIAWSLFLTAAIHAGRLLDQLVKGSSAPVVSNLPVLRFPLGLAQGGWVLLLSSSMLTVRSIASNAAIRAQFPDTEMPVLGVLDYATQLIDTLASNAQGFGWAAAVLAVVFWRPLLAWSWVIVLTILPTAWSELSFLLITVSVQMPARHGMWRPTEQLPIVWLLTLLMMIVMLGSFRSGRLLLAYGLFAAMLMSSLVSNTWRLLPLEHDSIAVTVIATDIADWAGSLWFRPASFAPSWYLPDSAGLGMLQVYLPPLNFTFNLPDWLQPISAMINLIWILLVWLIIAFFALRSRPGDRDAVSQ